MQKATLKIIEDIAKKKGLPVEVVKAAVESQFQCFREVTKEGLAGDPTSFKNVRLKHLGLFVVKPGQLLKIHANGSTSQKGLHE